MKTKTKLKLKIFQKLQLKLKNKAKCKSHWLQSAGHMFYNEACIAIYAIIRVARLIAQLQKAT